MREVIGFMREEIRIRKQRNAPKCKFSYERAIQNAKYGI
jgi:hypothetical protein